MQSIASILNFPDGTPIDAVQGRLTAVYPSKTISGRNGPSTVQNAELSDVAGNKVKLVVWNHPDLTDHKGKEYVLHNTSTKKAYPGIKVKIGSYVATKDGQKHKQGDTVKTFELEVTKDGCFQFIEVYNQNKPAGSPAAALPDHKEARTGGQAGGVGGPAQSGYINGASVGMAINNAVEVLKHNGPINPASFQKELYEIASAILKVSQHMEKGNFAGKAKEKTVAPATEKPVEPPTQEVIEDDVPF